MEIQANGQRTFRYPNGNVMMTGTYVNGKKHGRFTYHDINGYEIASILYVNDVPEGDATFSYNHSQLVSYKCSNGGLTGSTEYLDGRKFAVYNYGDVNVAVDGSNGGPPPVGSLYHAVDLIAPAERFPGTLWTYVENEYYIDDNGERKSVPVWLREANFSQGPYIYDGHFEEWMVNGMYLFVEGSYSRLPNNTKESKIHGPQSTRRENSTALFEATYEYGKKTGTIVYSNKDGQIWKSVNISKTINKIYDDGFYNVLKSYKDGKINYTFDTTNSAHLTKLK